MDAFLSQPATAAEPPDDARVVLHVGCGRPNPDKLHPLFRGGDWRELRLDIDPRVQPDIVASMVDLGCIEDVLALIDVARRAAEPFALARRAMCADVSGVVFRHAWAVLPMK